MVAVDQVHVPENVRELDLEHVKALAGSIKLSGVLVPVVVRPAANGDAGGRDYELVAGFHRMAAVREVGLAELPAVIREEESEASDRAVENITRRQLTVDEEARAVKAMLDRGLSEDGAAQALGWPKARVTARLKLLELPDQAQRLIGAGTIPLSAVDELRNIAKAAPALLDVLIEYLAGERGGWAGERLLSQPAWVIGQALHAHRGTVFAAYLSPVSSREIASLRLGKRVEEQFAEAEKLHRGLDRYAYGPPRIEFSEAEIDQARAAGVLLELAQSEPIITDRATYRELCKQAIKRTVEELRGRATKLAEEQKKAKAAGKQLDPQAQARREHRQQMRQLADQAHGANLDLGRALRNNLAVVDPAEDMNVARFFVFALLGSDYDDSPYTQSGERIAQLAVRGIRLVVDEFRTDVTKTRKDGSRGALRIDYGDARKPAQPILWIWRYLEAARTPGELFGRALVVIAAEQYASRLVLPASQRMHPRVWSSRKDYARKALAKLAGPHIPATLKQLEKAIARAEREDHQARTRTETRSAGQNDRTGSATASDEEACEEVELAA